MQPGDGVDIPTGSNVLFETRAAACYGVNGRSSWFKGRQICEFRLIVLGEVTRVSASEFRLLPYIVQREDPGVIIDAVGPFRMAVATVAKRRRHNRVV